MREAKKELVASGASPCFPYGDSLTGERGGAETPWVHRLTESWQASRDDSQACRPTAWESKGPALLYCCDLCLYFPGGRCRAKGRGGLLPGTSSGLNNGLTSSNRTNQGIKRENICKHIALIKTAHLLKSSRRREKKKKTSRCAHNVGSVAVNLKAA